MKASFLMPLCARGLFLNERVSISFINNADTHQSRYWICLSPFILPSHFYNLYFLFNKSLLMWRIHNMPISATETQFPASFSQNTLILSIFPRTILSLMCRLYFSHLAAKKKNPWKLVWNTCTCTHAHTCMCPHIHTLARTHACTHMHGHTCMHVHMVRAKFFLHTIFLKCSHFPDAPSYKTLMYEWD